MRYATRFGLVVLGAGLAAVAARPAGLRAQDPGPQETPWAMEAGGGLAVPAASLSDLEKAGPAATVGVAYWFAPRAALEADLSADFLRGRSATYPGILAGAVPDMTLWNYLGGVEIRVTPPSRSAFDVTADLEVGATTMRSQDSPVFAANGYTSPRFSDTFFTGGAGVRAAYWITRSLDLFLDGQARLVATSNAATRELVPFSDSLDSGGFEGAWVFPVEAGFKLAV